MTDRRFGFNRHGILEWVAPRPNITAGAPAWEQLNFRFRDDSAGLNANSGYLTTENNNLGARGTGTANKFRIRFTLDEYNDKVSSFTPTLYVSKNSGAYAAVTTSSSNVQATTSAQFTDADLCSTQLLGSPTAGAFEAIGEGSTDGACDLAQLNSKSGFFECEFCVYIVDADVADADTLDFRVYDNGSPTDTYTRTPRVTVSKGATYQHTSSDTADLGDSATTTVDAAPSSADTVDLGDSSTTVVDAAPSSADTFNLGDSASSTVSGPVPVANADTLDLGDEATVSLIQGYGPADLVLLGDEATANVLTVEQVTSADTADFGDSATVDVSAAPSAADAVDLGDSSSTVVDAAPQSTDTVNLGDEATAAVQGAYEEAAADTFKLGDEASTTTIGYGPADALVLGDSASSALASGIPKAAADTLELGDQATTGVSAAPQASDTVELGDEATAAATVLGDATDGLDLGDSSASSVAAAPTATDTLDFGDEASTVVSAAPAAADTLNLGDQATSSATGSYAESSADTLELGDSATAAVSAAPTAEDTLELGDSSTSSATGSYAESSADGVELGDSASTAVDAAPQAADTLELGDSASTDVAASPAAADGLEFGDSSSAQVSAAPQAADAIAFGDEASSATGAGGVEIYPGPSDRIDFSDTSSSTVTAGAPLPPNNVQATKYGDTEATVTWQDTNLATAQYQVAARPAAGGAWVSYATTDFGETSARIGPLPSGDWEIGVRALRAGVYSGWQVAPTIITSGTVEIYPGPTDVMLFGASASSATATTVPAPGAVTAIADGDNAALVTWYDSNLGLAQYEVAIEPLAGGGLELRATTDFGDTMATIEPLDPGAWRFAVRALRGGSYSAWVYAPETIVVPFELSAQDGLEFGDATSKSVGVSVFRVTCVDRIVLGDQSYRFAQTHDTPSIERRTRFQGDTEIQTCCTIATEYRTRREGDWESDA